MNRISFPVGGSSRKIRLRYVALASILVTLIIMNYAATVFPYLRSLGGRIMVVVSGSMSPFLNVGDIVVLRSASPEDIKVGDLIAFNVASRLQQQYNYPPIVTHRVVNIIQMGSELYFQTKGDATNADPFTVPATDVLGVYAWKMPFLGLPLMFLQTAYSIALLASYMVLDLALDYGPTWWKKRQQNEKVFATLLSETRGIKETVTRLSDSVAETTGPRTIILRRNNQGRAELVGSLGRLTVKRTRMEG